MINSPLTNPLNVLQDQFAIADLTGEIRVVDRHQIAAFLSGDIHGNTAMYKKHDAELMMKRCLEAIPISCNPKQVVADFWTSPATLLYKSTGFTPKATLPSVLNYWFGTSTPSG